MLRRETPVLD